MATVSTSFTAVSVSATLSLQEVGEVVTIALSGTYVANVQLERALTPDETSWETVTPGGTEYPWITDDATVSDVYSTTQKNEQLRLNCTAYTSGTVVTTLSDAEMIVGEVKDQFGNLLVTYQQDAGMVHTLPETHSGAETHSGIETHSGAETHTGVESHTGIETHAGAETAAAFMRITSGDPILFDQPTPPTATGTVTLSDAQMLGGILVATPATAVTYTTRTGTQIDAALTLSLEADMFFDLTIINLGGTGDDITMAVGVGVTDGGGELLIGNATDLALGIPHSGTFRFRRTGGNAWTMYRIG